MTTDSSDDAPQVGYKRPPRRHQFQPGQSGNPKGRVKGVRNLGTDVKRTLEAPVSLNDRGRGRRVSTQEAILLRLREKALRGDTRSLDRLLALAATFNDVAAPAAVVFDRPEDALVTESIVRRILLSSKDASDAEALNGSGEDSK